MVVLGFVSSAVEALSVSIFSEDISEDDVEDVEFYSIYLGEMMALLILYYESVLLILNYEPISLY